MKVPACLSGLLLLAAGCAAAAPGEPEANVRLPAFAVKGETINSYALDLKILAGKSTGQVLRLVVVRVVPYSDADRAGLEPGDEIVAINGVAVTSMEAGIGPDSPLGRLLVNQTPGTLMELEVVTHRRVSVQLRALRAPVQP